MENVFISAAKMRDKLLAALRREPLRLEDKRPRRSIKRTEIRIPVGHKLRCGTEIVNPFKLIVEAGVRWHPDWAEPRVTVNGWRVFPMGDALGWAGDELLADFQWLLEPEIQALALFHGQTLGEIPESAKIALARLSLAAPTAKQALSTFILPEQYGRRIN